MCLRLPHCAFAKLLNFVIDGKFHVQPVGSGDITRFPALNLHADYIRFVHRLYVIAYGGIIAFRCVNAPPFDARSHTYDTMRIKPAHAVYRRVESYNVALFEIVFLFRTQYFYFYHITDVKPVGFIFVSFRLYAFHRTTLHGNISVSEYRRISFIP